MHRRRLLSFIPAVPVAAAATQPAKAVDRDVLDDLQLRLMAWNLRSSTLDGLDPDMPDDVGLTNQAQMIEFLRVRDPDVLFTVETYGSGEALLDGLNADQPAERRYTGVQVTEGLNDPSKHRDNLWLFTRLPVLEHFPTTNEAVVSSFNFGGVRAALPSGGTICLFTTWLHYQEWAWGLTDDSVWDASHGLPRRHTDAEVIGTDLERREEMATTILEEWVPSFVKPGEPVIMGGDFNTLSHLDWTQSFADAPGHGGLVLDWPVMRRYEDAGYTDVFRTVHPDAGRYPGATWSPVSGTGLAPGRIDYVLIKGNGITPLAGRSDIRRLEDHRDFIRDAQFPFYSDHGSVTVDVSISGGGQRQGGPLEPLPHETPVISTDPPGERVAADQITASATSELDGSPASAVLDNDVTTIWQSETDQKAQLPQSIRLDLGSTRNVTALRYVPRQRYNGIINRYEVRTSLDGRRYRSQVQGERGFSSQPTVIPLRGRARYVELVAHHGYRGLASAAELEVYER